MKTFRFLLAVIALGIVTSYSGCKGSGSGESVQQKQFTLLSKTWKLASVQLSGQDVTSSQGWTNFQLAISGTFSSTTGTYNYTCTGRPALSPWPGSGTWAFATGTSADPVTQIVRDPSDAANALPMTYAVTTAAGSSAATLKISFQYSGNGYSRVSNVAGGWVFNFTAN